MVHDDKGLVVIAIFGMPPAAPHPNDPARAAHTALDLHARLAAAGIGASVGVTTGPAFSGFVGSRRRREMCAMGSTVNMAARLMAAADGGVLVDAATRDRSALTVRYAARPPLVVKGPGRPARRGRRAFGGGGDGGGGGWRNGGSGRGGGGAPCGPPALR